MMEIMISNQSNFNDQKTGAKGNDDAIVMTETKTLVPRAVRTIYHMMLAFLWGFIALICPQKALKEMQSD